MVIVKRNLPRGQYDDRVDSFPQPCDLSLGENTAKQEVLTLMEEEYFEDLELRAWTFIKL